MTAQRSYITSEFELSLRFTGAVCFNQPGKSKADIPMGSVTGTHLETITPPHLPASHTTHCKQIMAPKIKKKQEKRCIIPKQLLSLSSNAQHLLSGCTAFYSLWSSFSCPCSSCQHT